MASKYNNLTRLYRVNIQRKNSMGRKLALQGAPPLATQQNTKPTVPPSAQPAPAVTSTN